MIIKVRRCDIFFSGVKYCPFLFALNMMSETVGCHSLNPPPQRKFSPKKAHPSCLFIKTNGSNIGKWSQARRPDKAGPHPHTYLPLIQVIKNTKRGDFPTFRGGFFFFFSYCPIRKGSAAGEADGDAGWSASQATCFNIHDITSAPGRLGLHGWWCSSPGPLIGCLQTLSLSADWTAAHSWVIQSLQCIKLK